MRNGYRSLIVLFIAWCALLAGCDNSEAPQATLEPIAIEAGDECHVCGMIITRFPGPKGEAFVRHQQTPLKFCSTRDLFAWLLQPESAAIVQAVYVHDMGKTDWDAPKASALIPAESAWYVVGSRRQGSMGPTLASFRERSAAEDFAGAYGGEILAFDEIDIQTLERMTAPVLTSAPPASPSAHTHGKAPPPGR